MSAAKAWRHPIAWWQAHRYVRSLRWWPAPSCECPRCGFIRDAES